MKKCSALWRHLPEFDLWKINPETDFKMNPHTESLSVRCVSNLIIFESLSSWNSVRITSRIANDADTCSISSDVNFSDVEAVSSISSEFRQERVKTIRQIDSEFRNKSIIMWRILLSVDKRDLTRFSRAIESSIFWNIHEYFQLKKVSKSTLGQKHEFLQLLNSKLWIRENQFRNQPKMWSKYFRKHWFKTWHQDWMIFFAARTKNFYNFD